MKLKLGYITFVWLKEPSVYNLFCFKSIKTKIVKRLWNFTLSESYCWPFLFLLHRKLEFVIFNQEKKRICIYFQIVSLSKHKVLWIAYKEAFKPMWRICYGKGEICLFGLRFFVRWLILDLLKSSESQRRKHTKSVCQWFNFNNFREMCINNYISSLFHRPITHFIRSIWHIGVIWYFI